MRCRLSSRPGSVIEMLKIVDPLTDPTAHGASASDAFHLVIPSMPGYGFSGKPATTGWDPARIACAWVVLMKRLGYAQFVAQGSPMSPSSFSGKSWAGNRFSIANLRPSGSKKLYQFFSYVPFLFGEAVL